jgi:hypothetical protein
MFTFIGFVVGANGGVAQWSTPRGGVTHTPMAVVLRASLYEHGRQAQRAEPGMTVSVASFRRAFRKGTPKGSVRKVDAYKAQLNQTRKVYKDAYVLLQNAKKVTF